MELGVAPVVTSWVVVRLLAALLFDSDDPILNHRGLLNASRLVIGIVAALAEAAALGMCGNGGAGDAALVVLQLFAAGVVVVLADLLHETGYGVEGVSASSLLIATNTCERAVSHLFSPVKLRLAGAGPEFEGLVFAVAHRVAAAPPSWRHKAGALLFTLLRLDLPNLSNYMTTCVVFVLAVRLDETHLRRLYRSRPRRGTDEFVPIKLLYTSAMPIMLYAAAVSAFCVVSHQLHLHSGGGSFVVNLLGRWKDAGGSTVSSRRPPPSAGSPSTPAPLELLEKLVLNFCSQF
uniref:Uncharacterized protein n=1 Tax=Oryza meridionalis TaxID=40149 RepID=A0A0E0FEF7_9ORYZ